jgi:hypothetical protein
VATEQKQERKLGAVTYADPDKTEQAINVAGITFLPGEAVNVDELLPEDQASRLKEKLAQNPYFSVQGGPDHTKTAEERQKHEAEAEQKKQQLNEKKDQRAQEQAKRQIEANRPERATLEHPRDSEQPKRK